MPDSTQCPSAETLALLPDGRVSGRVRLSLMVHLDGCTPCRRVVAYTGQCEACWEPAPLEGPRKAFRMGVQLTCLRAGIEEGRRMDATEALRTLRSLGGPGLFLNAWLPLEDAPPKCLAREYFLEELGRLERELSSKLDLSALSLGRWAEASRLAAAGGDRRFFGEPYFQRMLESLGAEHLFHPIRAYAEARPCRIDMKGLERALRRLILLF